MSEKIYTNLQTASKEDVQKSFDDQRAWIVVQAWQLWIEADSINQNRFPLDPIDFTFAGFYENLLRLKDSGDKCPYFEMLEQVGEEGMY